MNQLNDEDIRRELELETGKIDGPWRPVMGSLLLSLATAICFLAAIAGTDPVPAVFNQPMARAYGLMTALILAVLAVILLRQPREARDPGWQPDLPGLRFEGSRARRFDSDADGYFVETRRPAAGVQAVP